MYVWRQVFHAASFLRLGVASSLSTVPARAVLSSLAVFVAASDGTKIEMTPSDDDCHSCACSSPMSASGFTASTFIESVVFATCSTRVTVSPPTTTAINETRPNAARIFVRTLEKERLGRTVMLLG